MFVRFLKYKNNIIGMISLGVIGSLMAINLYANPIASSMGDHQKSVTLKVNVEKGAVFHEGKGPCLGR